MPQLWKSLNKFYESVFEIFWNEVLSIIKMRFISERNKWFYDECDWSLLYFSSYQQRRVSCHPGDLSRKCHLCHGSCKSQKWGTRPPSSHYKTLRNIFPSLPSRELYFTLGSGGCALTFAGIMFLCIGFSQRYINSFEFDFLKKLLVQRKTKINKKRNGVVTLPWRLRLQ